jgi:hypothetical protein
VTGHACGGNVSGQADGKCHTGTRIRLPVESEKREPNYRFQSDTIVYDNDYSRMSGWKRLRIIIHTYRNLRIGGPSTTGHGSPTNRIEAGLVQT